MDEGLEVFISKYMAPRVAYKSNKSTIYLSREQKFCITKYIFDGVNIQQSLFHCIIRQLHEEKNNLHHCVRIEEIYNETDGFAIATESGECDLEDELIANPYKSEFEIVAIFYQLCKGVQEVHQLNIIHTDVRARNFIKFQNKNRTEYKLAGFDRAQYFDTVPKSQNGTIKAPEQIGNNNYNKKVDVYALGMILCDLIIGNKRVLTNNPQSQIQNNAEYKSKVTNLADYQLIMFEQVKSINKNLADIVHALLCSDPDERMQIDHVLQLLQGLKNTIQNVTLFGLIKLTFKQDYQSKKWLVNDNYNNTYNTFEMNCYCPLDNQIITLSNLRNIGIQTKDIYIPLHFSSPHIFNAELKVQIKVDENLYELFREINHQQNDAERKFIRLASLLVNLYKTIKRKQISAEELNFCFENIWFDLPNSTFKSDTIFNYDSVISLLLFEFYNPSNDRMQKVNQTKYSEQAIQDIITTIKKRQLLTVQQHKQIADALAPNQVELIQRSDLDDQEIEKLVSQFIEKVVNRNIIIQKILNNEKLSYLETRWLYAGSEETIYNMSISQYICMDKYNQYFIFTMDQNSRVSEVYIEQLDKSILEGQAISKIDKEDGQKQLLDSENRVCQYLNKINKTNIHKLKQQFEFIFHGMTDKSQFTRPIAYESNIPNQSANSIFRQHSVNHNQVELLLSQSNHIQHASTQTFLEFLHQYSNENEQTQQPIQYTQAAIYLCSSSNAIISDFKNDPSFGHDQKAIMKKLYEKSSELKYCTVIKDYFEQGDSFAIAMELGVCDLHEELEAIPYKSFFEKMAISLQLLSSIGELHENNIIHSDVKEANFIKFEEGGRIQYKIADFGLCQWINSTKRHYSGCYRAPEVLDYKQYTEGRDHWALGNVFYNLMVNEGHDGYLTEEIAFLKISPINIQFAKIVKSLLSSNPNLRPSLKDVKAQLQGIIDHIEEFYLYNIIELRFTKKQDNEWSIQNNFMIQFDNYTFQFENIRREQKSNKQLEIHDEYLKLDCTSIDIFNCSFRTQIKVDKAVQNLLSQYNNIAQPKQFVKLIFLLVQIQKTIFPDELVSGSQLQFCIEHSGQPLKASLKLYGKYINCKYLISLILFYFYSHRTQSVKEINKFQINQNHIIKKIINNQILYDQEIKWLYADQQEVINLMKISQQICVDKSNQCFIFTREDDHCHFFTKSAQQLGTNLFKQTIIQMDLKSPLYFICLKNSKNDQDQIHYYSFLYELIKQIRQINRKNNYLSQVEDAFLIKIDLEKKVSIKLLGQFIIKCDIDHVKKICKYLNTINSSQSNETIYQTIEQWDSFIRNQLYWLSQSIKSQSGHSTCPVQGNIYENLQCILQTTQIDQDQIGNWLNLFGQGKVEHERYEAGDTRVQQYQSYLVTTKFQIPQEKQIQLLRTLKANKFKYCINIIEVFEDIKSYSIITELIKDNLLSDLKKGEVRALFTKMTLMYQLALSLQELHCQGISHQNIKFENFVKVEQDTKIVYKLTGFTQCGLQEGFNQDILNLCQLFYLMLTNNYNETVNFQTLKIEAIDDQLRKVSTRINDLINILVARFTQQSKPPLYLIIDTLKSLIQKVLELQFFQCYKVEFHGNSFIDNFGNNYSDYLITYSILGEENPQILQKGSLNPANNCIVFEIVNPISNLKASIVLHLDNFILSNRYFFENLEFQQIMDIAIAFVKKNSQIMSTQQFQAIMVTKTDQSITYERKEYSVKMIISQMVLLHYYVNLNRLISDREQKVWKEFQSFVNKNPQFFKQ